MRSSPLRLPLAVLTCLLLVAALAAARGAEPTKVASVEGITEYQLDNGLRLLLYPDPSLPTVTVNMTVLVGSRHEGYGEAGMAHLLEHMAFKGTPTHQNVPKALRDRGASFNGTTNTDRTNYFETLPATGDNLEFAIRFEADRLVNSFIRREDLFSEMTVVRNEFERSENSPGNLLYKRLVAAAYDWHNYGKTTIGNRSDIERVPIDNLQDFYRRYYQPDNVVLIVAGKFDEADALKFTQQYFGAISRPERKLNTTYTEEPPQDGERKVELRRVGDVPLVAAVYHVPSAAHEDAAALDMLASILSTPPSGRLYQALVETKKASSAQAQSDDSHDPGLFGIFAEVTKGTSPDDVRDGLLATLDEVIAQGVTGEEVERARRDFLNARRRSLLNTSQFAVRLSSYVAQGDWRLYFLHRDRVEQVTPADVQRVAAKYFVASNRTLGYFIPSEAPALVEVPSTPDIAALVRDYKGKPPVASVPEFDYSFANIEAHTKRSTLPSGIKAALLPKPTRDEEVNLRLTLRYGNADNLKGQRAAASLLPALMNRGTKTLTYQQFRDELSRLDVSVNASESAAGAIEFSVRARRSSLGEALELLRQIMREPALDAAELEIIKTRDIASLEEARTDPQSLARDQLTRTLSPYPADDIRFTPPADEQIAAIKAVTIDQIRKLYADYLGAGLGELVIVGDFDPEQALAKIDEALAGWKAKMPAARVPRIVFTKVAGGEQIIQTPDKANAVYAGGLTTLISDRQPDHPALVLGNYILGGSALASRLGDRVRQKEGLSYGVGSIYQASSEDEAGTLMLYAICNPGNIGKVKLAIREEIDRLLKEGIPPEELEKARQGILQTRERQRSDESFIISRLQRSIRVGQTLAFDAEFDTKLAALKSADIAAALNKHIDPERLVIVTAGDFAKSNAGGK
jgi:zinc protease